LHFHELIFRFLDFDLNHSKLATTLA
jgi:hypothetical protein